MFLMFYIFIIIIIIKVYNHFPIRDGLVIGLRKIASVGYCLKPHDNHHTLSLIDFLQNSSIDIFLSQRTWSRSVLKGRPRFVLESSLNMSCFNRSFIWHANHMCSVVFLLVFDKLSYVASVTNRM